MSSDLGTGTMLRHVLGMERVGSAMLFLTAVGLDSWLGVVGLRFVLVF